VTVVIALVYYILDNNKWLANVRRRSAGPR